MRRLVGWLVCAALILLAHATDVGSAGPFEVGGQMAALQDCHALVAQLRAELEVLKNSCASRRNVADSSDDPPKDQPNPAIDVAAATSTSRTVPPSALQQGTLRLPSHL